MESINSEARSRARLQLVEEHVSRENDHDLEGIMATFGTAAHYDDLPYRAHYTGHEAVRAFYDELLRAIFRISGSKFSVGTPPPKRSFSRS
jgi:hypothetical protein